MELFVETLTGTAFELRVSPFETIMSVKAKIQRLEGIPISQQHLIWQSVELEDDYCLHDYNIHDGATLKLVLAMRGGPINTRRIPMESEPVLREMAEYIEANRDEILDKLPGNRQVTLLVFREGEQLNFFRVVDRGDGTLTPLSESLSNTSVYNLNEEDDDEDVPSQEQTEDNSRLKEKMKALRVKMDKLSIHRKPEPKLKLSSAGRANSRSSRLKHVSSSSYGMSGLHTSLKKAPCLPPVGKTYATPTSKDEQRTSSSENDELTFNFSDIGEFSSPDEALPSGIGTMCLKPTPEECAALSAKEELSSALEAVVNKLSESVVDRASNFEDVGIKNSDFFHRSDSLSGESYVNNYKAKTLASLSSQSKDFASCSDNDASKLSALRPPLIESYSSLTSDKKRHSIDDLKGTFLPHPPSSMSKSRDANMESSLENRLSKQSSKLLSASRKESISSSTMSLLDSSTIASTSNIASTGLDSVKETSSRSLSRYGQLDRRKEYTLESLSTSEARAMSGLLRQASIERLGSSRISNFVTSSSKSRLGSHGLGTGLKEGRVGTPEGRLLSARLRLVSSRDGHRLPPVKTKKKVTKRCFLCAKKTGPATGFDCRCGNNFCATHRYAEAHDCTFDYKTEGRKFLEQSNPVVNAPKLPKI